MHKITGVVLENRHSLCHIQANDGTCVECQCLTLFTSTFAGTVALLDGFQLFYRIHTVTIGRMCVCECTAEGCVDGSSRTRMKKAGR